MPIHSLGRLLDCCQIVWPDEWMTHKHFSDLSKHLRAKDGSCNVSQRPRDLRQRLNGEEAVPIMLS
jgi:hypothetical protein